MVIRDRRALLEGRENNCMWRFVCLRSWKNWEVCGVLFLLLSLCEVSLALLRWVPKYLWKCLRMKQRAEETWRQSRACVATAFGVALWSLSEAAGSSTRLASTYTHNKRMIYTSLAVPLVFWEISQSLCESTWEGHLWSGRFPLPRTRGQRSQADTHWAGSVAASQGHVHFSSFFVVGLNDCF